MTPTQVGKHWAIASITAVFIYPDSECKSGTALAAVDGKEIALSGDLPDMRSLTLEQARKLASVLDAAAAIAADWSSWVERDRPLEHGHPEENPSGENNDS